MSQGTSGMATTHPACLPIRILTIQAFSEKLIFLMFSSSMAVPWGLATLGVLFGSKLLLIPIQVLTSYLWVMSRITSKWHTCYQWCHRSARSAPLAWQLVLHLRSVGRTTSGEKSIFSFVKVDIVHWTILLSALNRECLLVAVAEAIPLAVIYLVAIIMACDLHRFQVRGRSNEFDKLYVEGGLFYLFLSLKCKPV